MRNLYEGLSKELLVKNWREAEADLKMAVDLIEVLGSALQFIYDAASDRDKPREDPEGGFELIRDMAKEAFTKGDKISQKIIDNFKETDD